MERSSAEMELPGFRFHPTEEELLDFYLKRVVQGKKLQFDIIPTVHLYRHNPWELPGLARIGEREWYFFVPRDRKQANGGRPSRTTERGFWKATGSDRPVRSVIDPKRLIGLKKTLVYYEGRAPRGTKTDWVMNEYRLPGESDSSSGSPSKEDIVLCKVYRKAVSLKELEQRVAMEETKFSHNSGSPVDSFSSTDHDPVQNWMLMEDAGSVLPEETKQNNIINIEEEVAKLEAKPVQNWILIEDDGSVLPKEPKQKEIREDVKLVAETVALPPAKQLMNIPELELPKFNALEWMQDPFLTQLRSPWMEQWSPYYNAGMLNF